MSFDLSDARFPDPLGRMLFTPARNCLVMHSPIPPEVDRLMEAAAVGLIDSEMVVEDSFRPFHFAGAARVQTPLPDFALVKAVAALIAAIEAEGFGPHAAPFFGLLGAIMLELSGDATQRARVSEWVAAGLLGCFAMTDAGGPLSHQWRSAWQPGSTPELVADKVWAMNASRAGFAIVVVRRGSSMALAPLLIGPEIMTRAETRATGAPFLDGQLPLGGLRLTLDTLPDGALLGRGGAIASKQFLALARPWLIKALVAHVRFLTRARRITPDARAEGLIQFLDETAMRQAARKVFDRYSEDQAMALKWVANETWLYMVRSGQVPGLGDARDLIGFTKIEGSSYRCFHDIYHRNARARVS